MAIISVKNLTKRFENVTAVDGISFEIEEGKITGLLGPNGAGKTTTIQMLLDIISPTSGEIKIFGKDLHKNREEVLGKLSFSSPYVALPNNLKVSENLKTFARLYGVKNIDKKNQRARRILRYQRPSSKNDFNSLNWPAYKIKFNKSPVK